MNELEEFAYQEEIKDRDKRITVQENQIRALLKEREGLYRQLDFKKKALKAPRWLSPRKRSSTKKHAVAVGFLSDDHFDEVVDPAELSGYNAYNREIATLRLRHYADDIIKITQHYWAGIEYEGFCLIGGGDIFNGTIHDELDRTNDGKGPYESLEYWTPQIIALILMLADVFGHVYIPWTVGNHGRWRQGKWGHKRRVVENLDWALGMRLQAHFANDDRVQFFVPEDTDVPFNVYDVRFLLNHGQTSGGFGVGGIFPPIFRLLAGLRKRWEFDVATLGHWHQDVFAPNQGLIINPTLKGYDEFSRDMKFQPEEPAQGLWLVSPEHGITWHTPVYVTDRKAEGW